MGNGTSQSRYSAKTTSTEIMEEFGSVAKGKFVVVTGGNSGIGWETSRALAEYGAHVTIACRSQQLGQEAVEKIQKLHPSADVSLQVLDLASLSSVEEFVKEYKRKKLPCHVLINNAGVMGCPLSYTKDGFEMHFGVNHLGHFALTMRLLDVLKSSSTAPFSSRVINVSSGGNYRFASFTEPIRFDDLKASPETYDAFDRYAASKVANILFSKQFSRRYAHENDSSVISVSLHPGMITGSNLGRYLDLAGLWTMLSALRRTGTVWAAFSEPFKSLPQGAATSLYCALAPEVIPGEYYSDCAVDHKELHPRANEEALAKQLWTVSEELTGVSEMR